MPTPSLPALKALSGFVLKQSRKFTEMNERSDSLTLDDDVQQALRNMRCIAKTVLAGEERACMREDIMSAARLLESLAFRLQSIECRDR